MAGAQLPFGNLPSRKVKGLLKVFGGTIYPFYFTMATVAEGQPVKIKPSSVYDKAMPNASVEVTPCIMGASDGPKAIGLAAQLTYDDNLSGQMGQLKDYHFVNDTAQRLNGQPIGILGGMGWAATNNFAVPVTAEQQAYVGPSGKLAVSGDTGDKLPVFFETSAAVGEMARIRFSFPLAVTG